ncbi:MAG: 4Fe-4S binding protein [Oligoflexia bacterium]|nr:4Fe-4S binding protein [Oligoflexia bacterium]
MDPIGDKPLKKRRKAVINSKDCLGCRNCYLNCRRKVIGHKKNFLGGHCFINEDRCTGCGNCLKMCINKCISLTEINSD